MLSRFPFLPGGMALIISACAMPQPGLRRSQPMEHTLLRGDQLDTARQILEERDINLLTAFGNLATLENRSFSVQLASVLEAPVIDGTSLRIIRILQQHNFLVVAYASADRSARGALVIVDLSDAENPTLRAELQLPTVDVQALAIDGRVVYFSGFSSEPSGPVVGSISMQNFEWQDDLKLQVLDLKSASALAVLDDQVVVLDRESAQLVTLQKNEFLTKAQMPGSGLSQLGQDASLLWSISHEPMQIQQWDVELRPKSMIPTNFEMKSSAYAGQMKFGRETMMASLGDGGVRAYCKANQKALFNIPAVIRADLTAERSQSLDAALSRGLLLTANADAGVYLYQVSTKDKQGVCKERELRFEGYLDLGKNFRAESLSWKDGILSVGDSEGRLNMFYIDSDTLENDDIDFDG